MSLNLKFLTLDEVVAVLDLLVDMGKIPESRSRKSTVNVTCGVNDIPLGLSKPEFKAAMRERRRAGVDESKWNHTMSMAFNSVELADAFYNGDDEGVDFAAAIRKNILGPKPPRVGAQELKDRRLRQVTEQPALDQLVQLVTPVPDVQPSLGLVIPAVSATTAIPAIALPTHPWIPWNCWAGTVAVAETVLRSEVSDYLAGRVARGELLEQQMVEYLRMFSRLWPEDNATVAAFSFSNMQKLNAQVGAPFTLSQLNRLRTQLEATRPAPATPSRTSVGTGAIGYLPGVFGQSRRGWSKVDTNARLRYLDLSLHDAACLNWNAVTRTPEELQAFAALHPDFLGMDVPVCKGLSAQGLNRSAFIVSVYRIRSMNPDYLEALEDWFGGLEAQATVRVPGDPRSALLDFAQHPGRKGLARQHFVAIIMAFNAALAQQSLSVIDFDVPLAPLPVINQFRLAAVA